MIMEGVSLPTNDFAGVLLNKYMKSADFKPICGHEDSEDLSDLKALEKLAEYYSGVSHHRLKRDSE